MKVAILGAGVAGVATAIALKQSGFDVSIYERHEHVSTIGAGIVVWPNAAYVLEQLGVLDEIEAVAGHPVKMRRLSHANEDLGVLDIELINRYMGYPSLSVLRGEFQNILISRLESFGVAIQYAHTVTAIESRNTSQAEVHFQNGSIISADVIVGADGRMASYARRYVHGENAPVYQGFINWIGTFESSEKLTDEIAVMDYWGVGERFGIVPITPNKAYWAGGAASKNIGTRNPADYKEELLSLFAEWPTPIRQIIEGTPTERINKVYVHDHDPLPVWHKHNVIVLGDAAHAALPTSGQGACQALEDAWHLANCLKENPQNLSQVFATFTALRFEKTAGIIGAGRGLAASLFNRDKTFCMARNANSKNTDFSKMAAGMSRAWAQHLPLGV